MKKILREDEVLAIIFDENFESVRYVYKGKSIDPNLVDIKCAGAIQEIAFKLREVKRDKFKSKLRVIK